MTEGNVSSLSDHIRKLKHQERRQTGMPDIQGFLEDMKKLGVKTSTSIVISCPQVRIGGNHG